MAAVDAEVPAGVDGRRELGARAASVVAVQRRVASLVERAVGRRGRDEGPGVLGQVDHGLGTGHGAVRLVRRPLVRRRPGVGLPLLPLVQLPHGVVTHGASLLHAPGGGVRRGAQHAVVERGRDAAHAVGPRQAVARERAVAVGVEGHRHRRPVARHVPGQRLVGGDAEKPSRLKKKKRKKKRNSA